MDKKLKNHLLLITFGVALLVALEHFSAITQFLKDCLDVLSPVLTGLLLAFVLSVPMQGFAKRIKHLFPKVNDTWNDIISLALTLLCVVAVLALACLLVIPQLIQSVRSVITLIEINWPDWASLLQSRGIDTSMITNQFADFDWNTVIEKALHSAGTVIGSVVNFAGSTISSVVNFCISIVVTFYVLLGRKTLSSQTKRFLYAYCKTPAADRVCHIAKLAHDTYAKFLSGQCVEVVILGLLILVSFSAFGIPYAGLSAFLTAVLAFIPYIGAFISCVVAVLLTLLAVPRKALLCLIVYQVSQFVENQFIYPHVVGNSVGLSPFWTLLAVLIGGKLFGVIGIVFFIPLMALISQLLSENIDKRLKRKQCLSKE